MCCQLASLGAVLAREEFCRKCLVRYKSFRNQAESESKPRSVVAKAEQAQGELFAGVGFIVTSMVLPSRSLVRFDNKRATAE